MFVQKCKNWGYKLSFWKNLGVKFKFGTSVIFAVGNLELYVWILSEICSDCRNISTSNPAYFFKPWFRGGWPIPNELYSPSLFPLFPYLLHVFFLSSPFCPLLTGFKAEFGVRTVTSGNFSEILHCCRWVHWVSYQVTNQAFITMTMELF